MMDFVVRELRQVVSGPMAMMRYGTCGVISPYHKAGDVLVASKGACFIQTNGHEIAKGSKDKGYTIFKPIKPDSVLSNQMIDNMKEIIGKDRVKGVLNCSADSFYGSEGRPDPNFVDHNETLIDDLMQQYPEAASLEMETFCLFHLASLSKEKIHACAAAIGLIQRDDPANFLPPRKCKELEDLGGLAILKSLTEFEFPKGEPEYTTDVLSMLRAHDKEHSPDASATQMAIHRIMANNPKIKAALEG